MTVRKYQSRSQKTALASPLASGANTMTVNSGPSLVVSSIPSGATFTVVIDPDTSLEEIVEVINWSSGNTLTINRGVDGSSDVSHSAGAVVRHMAIGRDYRESNDHIENVTTAHGLTIANVLETTDTNMITTAMLQANAVTTAKITDLNVTTAKIADGAITSAKLADGGIGAADIADSAVTTAKVADSAITSAKIADGTIVAGDIADSAITSAKILDGTIATGDLADSAVTSAKIADATIVNADISNTAGIAYSKLSLGGTITSADLVDGTIVNSDINASAGIALSKLAVDPLARANHTGTQAASTISDFNTAVRTNRLDQMAAPTAAVPLNAQKITGLADPTNAQDAVTLNYITTQKGAVNGLAELDGSGLVPTHHLPALAITTTQVVNSQANMLALTAQVGDVAVRTDVNKSFILTATPATTLANWQELLTPTDAVLSVDGSTGAISLSGTYLNRTSGQLLGALDANNFKITNLGTPTSNADAATKVYVDTVAGSATAAAASATAAAASYDSFDDRYLGSKSTPPSVDNDGNALITGALYWDTVSDGMFVWSGSAWVALAPTAAIYRYRFTASGGETSLSGTDANGLTLSYVVGKEQVYLNGVLLVRNSDYTASTGTSITSLSALVASDIVEIITFTPFEIATAVDSSLFTAKGDILVATGVGTAGKEAAGTNGYFLRADSTTTTGLGWATVLTGTGGDVGKTLYTGTATPSSATLGDIWIDVALDTTPDLTIMTIMGAY